MKPLMQIVLLLVRAERRAVMQGLALSVVVLAMGAALLGLSGWFITAAAAAGMAGIGILFNVFAPSAMVRFLALGRTVARYGERLTSHDAVLRALTALRLRLLRGLLTRPHREIESLRVASALNRLTADVDALDSALLRLVLPGLAGSVTILVAAAVLWWLVHPLVALLVGFGYLVGPNIVFALGQRAARKPARRAEAALQAMRGRLIALVTAREDLTVYGQILSAQRQGDVAVDRHEQARARLDAIERSSGFGLDLVGALVTGGALGLGAMLVEAGALDPARAAIGVFVSLALAEAVAPVRRALGEVGTMIQAARRMHKPLAVAAEAPVIRKAVPGAGGLRLDAVTWRRGVGAPIHFAPLSVVVAPGETVALTGPSGVGKSTVLLIAAGALRPDTGHVWLGDVEIDAVDPNERARHLVMVPQRHGLISGTVAENLRLAAPEATDAVLWQALEACALAETLRPRGGLEFRLGARGAGLSGGEARRLVLARAVLCAPSVLLLDEPTEGLDTPTAVRVMSGVRAALPAAAILVAAHRKVEHAAATRVVTLRHADAEC